MAVLVIFVARPISVFLVTVGDRTMGFKERYFLSWAGVKGVASAALAAISVTVIIQYAHLLTGQMYDDYQVVIANVVPTIYAIVFIVFNGKFSCAGIIYIILCHYFGID